jgi:hypothetical protein
MPTFFVCFSWGGAEVLVSSPVASHTSGFEGKLSKRCLQKVGVCRDIERHFLLLNSIPRRTSVRRNGSSIVLLLPVT